MDVSVLVGICVGAVSLIGSLYGCFAAYSQSVRNNYAKERQIAHLERSIVVLSSSVDALCKEFESEFLLLRDDLVELKESLIDEVRKRG